MFNVLVTGCGGDIGLGIGRILKMWNPKIFTIGCDIHDEHPGSFIFDKCEIVVRVDTPGYFENIRNIIDKYKIDLVIPSSEPELRFLFKKHMLERIDNVPIITANNETLDVGFDKFKTAMFLKSNNLPFPWTKIVKDGFPEEMPCIIKSRFGSGSRSVQLVDTEMVDYFTSKRPDDIWQEYLLPENQEFTCGVYGLKTGEIRSIIIRRRLQGGHTVYGEVINNSEISDVLLTLSKALQLRGSINIQLRLTKKGPVVFEINPRFSSTLVFRHLIGFQDLIWSILEKIGQSLDDYVPEKKGTRFYRGDCEYIKNI